MNSVAVGLATKDHHLHSPLSIPPNVQPRSGGYARYLVLALLCLAAMIAYAQRNSLSVAEEAMRTDLDLDKKTMGWVMSAFFLTYALLQLPTGWIAKTAGTRKALPLFTVLFSAAAGSFALASGVGLLLAARLGMGAFQAGLFPCAVNTVSKWMPDSQRSLSNGLLAAFMSVGGALGGAMMGVLLPTIGWRWALALYSLPGFLFAVAFYLWFRDTPEEYALGRERPPRRFEKTESETDQREPPPSAFPPSPTPWGAMFTSIPLWALCGQQVFRAAGYIFFASWFTTFLRETRGVEDFAAGVLTSLPLIAVVVGSPLGGLLSDFILARTGSRRASRQGLSAVSMVACAVLVMAAYPIENAALAVAVISLGSFVASFAGSCAYTATIDLGGRHTAMVFSLMNMLGNLGAFLFPLAVPYLLNEGETSGSGNWTLVLFTFAGLYVAAALCWLFADTRQEIVSSRQHEPAGRTVSGG